MASNSAIPIVVRVGERELLSSGVVHIEGPESVLVQVAGLKFNFNFRTDDGATRYDGRVDDGILYFDLYNHTNPLGEGKFQPVEIAQVGSRTLSITYFVNTLNAETSTRRFEYALYLGDAK